MSTLACNAGLVLLLQQSLIWVGVGPRICVGDLVTEGQIIGIPVKLSGGESGAVAVELSVGCLGSGIQIRSVEFHAAFSLVLGESEGSLPASTYRVARAQPLGKMDRMLGAADTEITLATIELEVLTDEPFSDELEIKVAASRISPTVRRADHSAARWGR